LSSHCNIESSQHYKIVTAMQQEMIRACEKGGQPMAKFPRSRFLNAVNALFVLTLTAAGAPVLAEAPTNNLGPVGPREPILATVGGQRVIAFFVPERGECAVSAVTWKDGDASAPYASARVRISLKPGQTLSLDGAQRQSMGLLCEADASTLAVVAPAALTLTGANRQD
jgi:hypothetical protein